MRDITPHTAFTPALEVQDIGRFAGRNRELDALSNALQAEGAQLVLYGQRGIGKSSLARVLTQLATNDVDVIGRLSSTPLTQFDFLPIYLACDDTLDCIEKLLIRLLTDESALAPWIPYKVVERRSDKESGGKLGIKILELSGKLSGSITERLVEVEADTVGTFTNACKSVVRSGVAKDGLLIVVDEFDRITDRAGIASLLKALGPEKVTFAIVGVASTIQDLIKEHTSVARQLADGAINVSPMSDDELREIISRALAALDNHYAFNEPATNWIVSIARGHPFYVQLVGKHALLRAIGLGQKEVTEGIARDALADIAMKGSAPIQESLYKTAIGHSYVREFVLKRFSQRPEDEIHTTELYAEIARDLSIDTGAVSVYVGHLASDKYGAALEKARDRYYRFGDSLFKAYAAARPFERKPGDRENDG